jgi:hypothetical protein
MPVDQKELVKTLTARGVHPDTAQHIARVTAEQNARYPGPADLAAADRPVEIPASEPEPEAASEPEPSPAAPLEEIVAAPPSAEDAALSVVPKKGTLKPVPEEKE